MSDDLKFLIDVVKQASNLITDDFEVKAKDAKGDLVTNFDYEIENFIIKKIKKNYPNFSIISEEYNTKQELTDNCFTIDPIDGTVNFAHNIPLWGIQVACIKNKKTCAAVIYLPRLNELYYADENGAFMNDKPISVNNFGIDKGIYAIEGPKKYLIQGKIIEKSRNCRNFNCAAVSFAWVACGRLSATNFVYDTLWDYIPGEFIVKKAGGVIYNKDQVHIASNTNEFLNILKDNSLLFSNNK